VRRQVLRAGRRPPLQDLRRRLLLQRGHVEKALAAANSLEDFKKIIMAAPMSFTESEASEMCADVPKSGDGKR